jgi:hypothetical protein
MMPASARRTSQSLVNGKSSLSPLYGQSVAASEDMSLSCPADSEQRGGDAEASADRRHAKWHDIAHGGSGHRHWMGTYSL